MAIIINKKDSLANIQRKLKKADLRMEAFEGPEKKILLKSSEK